MFRPALAKLLASTVIVAGACTGIVYATRGLAAKQTAVTDAPRRRQTAPTDSTSVTVETAARKPVDYYARGISAELFGLPAPKPAPPAPRLPPPPAVKVEEPDPFSDYVYNGTVSIDGKQMALLENKKTKEGQYVAIGQPFLGGQVTAIDDRQVSVSLGKTNKAVAKTDDYKLVSLDKNAPYLNEGGNAGAAPPGAPGGPPQPGGPGGPGMGMRGGFGRGRGMFMGGPGGPMPGGPMRMDFSAPMAAPAAVESSVLKLSGDAVMTIEK